MERKSGLQTPPTISIIIPILNEAKILDRTLSRLQPELGPHELIIVDGGSSDNSVCIAKGYGEVLTSARGRAKQLNAGAAAATGDILLFLHADVWLETGALVAVEAALSAGYIGGGFRQKIDGKCILYRLIEIAGDIRGKYLKVFYGDSGIFLARATFEKIGGFPDVPILEEMEFSRGLRKLGKTTLIGPHIHLSARRWEARGIIRTTLNNWLITFLYFLKVSPERLAKLYSHIR
ncbi:MAG: TIGR04283 family arsenosugar biosynthesis glycosyltransferase [Candidatus Poribacteria bacterium]|nr:TIGR04283 family arsenosugar biosynthesis glycosyltransferase [Candidatus Poribacteria bacterium]